MAKKTTKKTIVLITVRDGYDYIKHAFTTGKKAGAYLKKLKATFDLETTQDNDDGATYYDLEFGQAVVETLVLK